MREAVKPGNLCRELDQTEFLGTFDRRAAIVGLELGVNVLRMRTQGAQGDGEFASDLWPGQDES